MDEKNGTYDYKMNVLGKQFDFLEQRMKNGALDNFFGQGHGKVM